MNTDKLRELALAATEGPWTAHDGGLSERTMFNPITKKDELQTCSCAQVHCEHTTVAVAIGANDESYTMGEGVTDEQRCINAAYIAAANPTAIIELLDALEASGELVGEWRSECVDWPSVTNVELKRVANELEAVVGKP